MRLNNKGFAITGILYTLFILFTLLLISVLSGLSSKITILEKSLDSIKDDYEVITDTTSQNKWVSITVEDTETAPEDGKYEYDIINVDESGSGSSSSIFCYTYLKEGSSLTIDDIVFTTEDCNDNNIKDTLVLKGYYPFQGND